MDEKQFRHDLEQGGYRDIQTVEWTPNTFNDTHIHDFDAYLLILDGEITIESDRGAEVCKIGDTFSLNAGVPHTETVGANGVRFLSGRK